MAKARTRKKSEQLTPEQAEAAAVAIVQDAQERPEVYDAAIENTDFDPAKFEKEARELKPMTAEELAKPVPDREELAHQPASSGALLPSGNAEAPSTAVENAAVARKVVDDLARQTELPPESKPFAERVQHSQPRNGAARPQGSVFPEYGISLTDEHDGPRMRMFREKTRFGDFAAIQFPEKPSDDIRQKMHDNGWSWKQGDKAWKKGLGDNPGVEHRKAQELFEAIANEIRQDNGLEPVTTNQGLGR